MEIRRLRKLEKVLAPKRSAGLALIEVHENSVYVQWMNYSKKYTIEEYEKAVSSGEIEIEVAIINDIPRMED